MRHMIETQLLEKTASVLDVPLPSLVKDSLRSYLERHLWEEQATIHEMKAKYGVFSFEDMKRNYESGTLEEEGTWEDFMRLEHAEARVEKFRNLLLQI